jgi:hypothetical protein
MGECVDDEDVNRVLLPYAVYVRDLVWQSGRQATRAMDLQESERVADERGLDGRCRKVHSYCRLDSGQDYSVCMTQQACGPGEP